MVADDLDELADLSLVLTSVMMIKTQLESQAKPKPTRIKEPKRRFASKSLQIEQSPQSFKQPIIVRHGHDASITRPSLREAATDDKRIVTEDWRPLSRAVGSKSRVSRKESAVKRTASLPGLHFDSLIHSLHAISQTRAEKSSTCHRPAFKSQLDNHSKPSLGDLTSHLVQSDNRDLFKSDPGVKVVSKDEVKVCSRDFKSPSVTKLIDKLRDPTDTRQSNLESREDPYKMQAFKTVWQESFPITSRKSSINFGRQSKRQLLLRQASPALVVTPPIDPSKPADLSRRHQTIAKTSQRL